MDTFEVRLIVVSFALGSVSAEDARGGGNLEGTFYVELAEAKERLTTGDSLPSVYSDFQRSSSSTATSKCSLRCTKTPLTTTTYNFPLWQDDASSTDADSSTVLNTFSHLPAMMTESGGRHERHLLLDCPAGVGFTEAPTSLTGTLNDDF